MKRSKALIVPVLIIILTLSSTVSFAAAGADVQPPTGAVSPLAAGETVDLVGWWGGYCSIYGARGGGTESHNGGTLRLLVDGVDWTPGYCIDLDHSLGIGNEWTADVYLATEADLCAANWIVTNYDRDNPGWESLSAGQQGAAVQAAIWYYVEGFDPIWSASHWCGVEDVYNLAEEIITAADGQCGLFPASLDLDAVPIKPAVDDTVNLTATVLDQFGAGFEGQQVDLETTPDTVILSSYGGLSNVAGEVYSSFTFPGEIVYATASMTVAAAPWTLNDVAGQKQRLLILRPYDPEVTKQVPPPGPTAVELAAFSATAAGNAIRLDWETASELDNLGFNLYRAAAPGGQRIQVNAALIAGQAPGSAAGATYRFVDESVSAGAIYYYWLEAVDVSGGSSLQGPVSARLIAASRLLPMRQRVAPISTAVRTR